MTEEFWLISGVLLLQFVYVYYYLARKVSALSAEYNLLISYLSQEVNRAASHGSIQVDPTQNGLGGTDELVLAPKNLTNDAPKKPRRKRLPKKKFISEITTDPSVSLETANITSSSTEQSHS